MDKPELNAAQPPSKERDLQVASASAVGQVLEYRRSSGTLTMRQRERLVISDKSKTTSADESQRDSDPKPKVARHELPWVNANQGFPNPNGVAAFSRPNQSQPRWGWRDLRRLTQGSSCLATLGWRTQSLWDCPQKLIKLWLMTRRERRSPSGMGNARVPACCARRPRRPLRRTRTHHPSVPVSRFRSDWRVASRNTRGRVCSPISTAHLRLGRDRSPFSYPCPSVRQSRRVLPLRQNSRWGETPSSPDIIAGKKSGLDGVSPHPVCLGLRRAGLIRGFDSLTAGARPARTVSVQRSQSFRPHRSVLANCGIV
jgi:hypothetical protein